MLDPTIFLKKHTDRGLLAWQHRCEAILNWCRVTHDLRTSHHSHTLLIYQITNLREIISAVRRDAYVIKGNEMRKREVGQH